MKHHAKALGIATFLILAPGLAAAGPCKDVKFSIKNSGASTIKATKIGIGGNDGTWREDVANRQIDPNKTEKTNGRRLQKLDSGAVPGHMVLYYDKRNANIQGGWEKDKQRHVTNKVACTDGMTYSFNVQ
ncbi:MAG: hypothetical protein AB7P21_17490 [Lautropia sp.]